MVSRHDITKKYVRAYQFANKVEKTRLLDALVETTGRTRDHARLERGQATLRGCEVGVERFTVITSLLQSREV